MYRQSIICILTVQDRFMMTKTPDTLDRTVTPTAQYRSGVAARLAGLPVETLRVWERRYGNSDTGRSEHRQRLYSQAQVRRLRLIKQLVDQGHPIGALAQLPLEQLGALAVAPVPFATAQLLRVVLAGSALAPCGGRARNFMVLWCWRCRRHRARRCWVKSLRYGQLRPPGPQWKGAGP